MLLSQLRLTLLITMGSHPEAIFSTAMLEAVSEANFSSMKTSHRPKEISIHVSKCQFGLLVEEVLSFGGVCSIVTDVYLPAVIARRILATELFELKFERFHPSDNENTRGSNHQSLHAASMQTDCLCSSNGRLQNGAAL